LDRASLAPGALGPAERRRSRAVRLVFLIDKLGAGGAQTHLGALVSGLDPVTFAPTVVCLNRGGRTADSLKDRGLQVRVLKLGRLYAPAALRAWWDLALWLRRERVEILHTYLSAANVFGALVARASRVPCLITTRRDTGFADGRRMRRALSFTSRWATGVVAVSEDAARVARERDRVRPEVLEVIPNGIDLGRFSRRRSREDARRLLGLPERVPLVVMVGHVTWIKGVDLFIEAAVEIRRELRDARFVVAGDGREFDSMNDLIRKRGLEASCQLLGRFDDVPALLEAGDVFVLPSRAEGMPNALLEAMGVGIPTVASRVGGVPEIVRDGLEALLVEPENVPELAAACLRVLRDPGLGRALSSSALRRVTAEFDLGLMVRRYEALYRRALEAKEPSHRIAQ